MDLASFIMVSLLVGGLAAWTGQRRNGSILPGACRRRPTPAWGKIAPFNTCPEPTPYPGMSHAKKVFIRTFGCQMNEYDSDKMSDVLHADSGYEKTENA